MYVSRKGVRIPAYAALAIVILLTLMLATARADFKQTVLDFLNAIFK